MFNVKNIEFQFVEPENTTDSLNLISDRYQRMADLETQRWLSIRAGYPKIMIINCLLNILGIGITTTIRISKI